MFEAAFAELLVVCGIAAGLVLFGVTSVVAAGRSLAVRLGASGGAAAIAVLLPALNDDAEGSLLAASVVGLTALVAVMAGLRMRAIGRRLARPKLQASVFSAAGGVLLVAGLGRFEFQDAAISDRDIEVMVSVGWRPRLQPAATEYAATTDTGRSIALLEPAEPRQAEKVAASEILTLAALPLTAQPDRISAADEATNCHGWVFTGGRYWLSPDDVEKILADNGYEPVTRPRPGDVAVYRNAGTISHSAVVEAADNGCVQVTSKWGWMSVFRHSVEASCYGTAYTFYRSPREGHLLAGLGGQPSPARSGDSATLALLRR